MALLLKQLYLNYRHIIIDLADPRTINWPLMRSPIPVTAIVVMYFIFATIIGPDFMRNKKPYDLRKVLIVYNACQILMNLSLVTATLPIFLELNWNCSEVDYSPEKTNVAFAGYLYFLVKIVDLLDTVFFVLRKKNNQITFLHIYHHGMIIYVAWIGAKYIGGGHSIFLPYFNTCVHVFMYSYYLASIVSNNAKRVVWWKKYMTQLQMAQFALLFWVYILPFFDSNCNFPTIFLYFMLPQNFAMIILFGDFYYRAYLKPNKSTA